MDDERAARKERKRLKKLEKLKQQQQVKNWRIHYEDLKRKKRNKILNVVLIFTFEHNKLMLLKNRTTHTNKDGTKRMYFLSYSLIDVTKRSISIRPYRSVGALEMSFIASSLVNVSPNCVRLSNSSFASTVPVLPLSNTPKDFMKFSLDSFRL